MQIFWFQNFSSERNFLPIDYLPVQKMETLQNKFKFGFHVFDWHPFNIFLDEQSSKTLLTISNKNCWLHLNFS